jgi:hypothetical protein
LGRRLLRHTPTVCGRRFTRVATVAASGADARPRAR